MNNAQTNSIDESMMTYLLRQQIEKDEVCRKAAVDRKNFRSRIKGYGIKLKNFDVVYGLFKTNDDENGDFVEDLREQRRLMRLASLPVGYQFTLFGDTEKPSQPTVGVYSRGVRAFIEGKQESDNPHPANTSEGQDWLSGFRMAESNHKEGAEKAAQLDQSSDDTDEDEVE